MTESNAYSAFSEAVHVIQVLKTHGRPMRPCELAHLCAVPANAVEQHLKLGVGQGDVTANRGWYRPVLEEDR